MIPDDYFMKSHAKALNEFHQSSLALSQQIIESKKEMNEVEKSFIKSVANFSVHMLIGITILEKDERG